MFYGKMVTCFVQIPELNSKFSIQTVSGSLIVGSELLTMMVKSREMMFELKKGCLFICLKGEQIGKGWMWHVGKKSWGLMLMVFEGLGFKGNFQVHT